MIICKIDDVMLGLHTHVCLYQLTSNMRSCAFIVMVFASWTGWLEHRALSLSAVPVLTVDHMGSGASGAGEREQLG